MEAYVAATVSTEEMIALVARAQEGDVEAFEELVRVFQDVAVAYAYVRLGDFYQAEDAAQSSFLDAYQHLSQLREPAAFAGWLRQIVHKHCDRLRRGKRLPTADLET